MSWSVSGGAHHQSVRSTPLLPLFYALHRRDIWTLTPPCISGRHGGGTDGRWSLRFNEMISPCLQFRKKEFSFIKLIHSQTHTCIPIGMLREEFSQSGNIQVRSLPDAEDPLPLLKNSTKDEYLLPSIGWPRLNCCSTSSGGKTSCSQTDTVTCLTEGSIGQKYDKIRRSPPTDRSPPESPGPRKPPYGI